MPHNGRHMKGNNIFYKIAGTCIALLFLSSATLPPVLAQVNKNENNTPQNDTNKTNKTATTTSSDTHYYAVIAACSQYKDPKHDIPKNIPFSDEKLMVLYNALLQSKNWNKSNIILLINQNATKQNLTTALQHMAAIVGPNDYFLFSWSGHGTEVPDTNGDESHFDPNDTMDEAICPYDTEEDQNHTMHNILIDDELGHSFSNITCKGMTLVFDCCFSGGLIDRSTTDTPRLKEIEYSKAEQFSNSLKQDIQHPQSSDVNGNNRIILLSTLPDHIERAVNLTGFPLIAGLAIACLYPKLTDRNKDSVISTEEAFRIARPLALIQSSLIWIYFYVNAYLFFKLDLYNFYSFLPLIEKFFKHIDTLIPISILPATFFILSFYIQLQIFYKVVYGHYSSNWPNMLDEYPGELPLFQT